MSSNGAICHLRTTSGGGFGKTTVTEFLFRHAGIPLSLNRATAYSATSRQPATVSLKPSIPCWRSAYHIISGVMALRDPAIVVSSAPMYSIDPGDARHVFAPREGHPAGDGGADHLVAADSHAVKSGVEPVRLGVVHKGQYHAAQGRVRVYVRIGDRQIVEDGPDLADVVDRALHRRAYVRDKDDRQVPVDPDGLVQVFVVDLAVVLALDHDVARPQQAQDLDDAVVGVLREVDDAVREHLSPDVEAVDVALGPAGGDVAPRFLPRQARHFRELADDLSLHLVGVASKVAVVERVADVVDGVLHEGQQRRVVEVVVARIADLLSVQRLEVVLQGVEALSRVRARLVHVVPRWFLRMPAKTARSVSNGTVTSAVSVPAALPDQLFHQAPLRGTCCRTSSWPA